MADSAQRQGQEVVGRAGVDSRICPPSHGLAPTPVTSETTPRPVRGPRFPIVTGSALKMPASHGTMTCLSASRSQGQPRGHRVSRVAPVTCGSPPADAANAFSLPGDFPAHSTASPADCAVRVQRVIRTAQKRRVRRPFVRRYSKRAGTTPPPKGPGRVRRVRSPFRQRLRSPSLRRPRKRLPGRSRGSPHPSITCQFHIFSTDSGGKRDT